MKIQPYNLSKSFRDNSNLVPRTNGFWNAFQLLKNYFNRPLANIVGDDGLIEDFWITYSTNNTSNVQTIKNIITF